MSSVEIFDGYKNTLVSRLYGVLCEREKKGDWLKMIDNIEIELLGFDSPSINYWRLRGCIGALKYLDYNSFRKTIFDCIHLVQGIQSDELH